MLIATTDVISRVQAREWVLSFQPAIGTEIVDPWGDIVEEKIFSVDQHSELVQPQIWCDTVRRVLKLVDCSDVNNFRALRDGQTGIQYGIQFMFGKVVCFNIRLHPDVE
jgi:hypothetical protein